MNGLQSGFLLIIIGLCGYWFCKYMGERADRKAREKEMSKITGRKRK
jgi:uncharacterized membrane protein YuzA (DUF378 family)